VTALFARELRFVFAPAKRSSRAAEKLIDLHMPRIDAERRYSIEIKDAEGSVVFRTVVYWDDTDKRTALAQITGLAPPPEVNVYPKPALSPQVGNKRQRSGTRRLDPEPR
jgi:hypothetical protein